MKKTIAILTLLIIGFTPFFAFADGFMFTGAYQEMDYVKEDYQQAYIDFRNGRQKMLLNIEYKEIDNDIYWLFPVPGDPEQINIDLLENDPRYRGDEIDGMAKQNLEDVQTMIYFSQGYPIITSEINYNLKGTGAFWDSGGNNNIRVYEHVEKDGMVSELISSKEAKYLSDYLKSKNLKVENQILSVLEDYINKNFCFVVSWIKPPEKLEKKEINKKMIEEDLPDILNNWENSYKSKVTHELSITPINIPNINNILIIWAMKR